MGVHYVIVRDDLKGGPSESPPELTEKIEGAKQLLREKQVYSFGRFTVYRLNPVPEVSFNEQFLMGNDDISKVSNRLHGGEYVLDQYIAPYLAEALVTSDTVPNLPRDDTISVVLDSKHHNPGKYWSVGSLNGGYLATIQPYMKTRDINNWQFDYHKASIFTWNQKYSEGFDLSRIEPIRSFSFDEPADSSGWQLNAPKQQSIRIVDGAMEVSLNSSSSGWKTISSPTMDVNGSNTYAIQLTIKFHNSEGIHSKIIEMDENEKVLATVRAGEIGSGTADWKNMVFEYKPSSPEVRKVKISIWHGHLSARPLPNIFWLDYVRLYDVSDKLIQNAVTFPFTASRDGNYTLFIRYLESPEGGLLHAYVDDA
ncbi:MAG: hypothetical protein ACREBU_16745, partial [Nitrososphaera sp.]